MNLNKVKGIILNLGAAALFVVAPGCFTGVESTPRIQVDKGDKGAKTTTPEEQFFASVAKQPPGEWGIGKRFIVVDDRFRRLLGASSLSESLQGQVIKLSNILTVTTVLGDSVIELQFACVLSDRPLVYRTTISPAEWHTRPSFAIPFLVETDVIENAKKLLTNKRLWVRNRSGWTEGSRRRFIPVIIDSVSGGDETYPLLVKFHAEDNPAEKGQHFLSDADARPGDRHAFGLCFSLLDLRREYPGISDAIWQGVVNGKPLEGMTPNEARLCLGAPKEIRNNNSSSILRQEWMYPDGRVLVFENQLLVSWN